MSLLLPRVAGAEPVALTFDDVPGLALPASGAYASRTNRRLTEALVRRRVPAIGFVVGDKYALHPGARGRMLRCWTRGRLHLGNHTYSHLSLNAASPRAYLRDVDCDDRLLRAAAGGASPRWFRHPYLETGPTEHVRGAEAGLRRRGYRTAPVTLENDDDLFAGPYDDAVLRHDHRRMRAIRGAYLTFTARRIAWYRQAGLQLLGRRPALVFLLHDTRLNADSLGAIVVLLEKHGLQPTPLAAALRDEAYTIPDGPATADGDDWLNRWAAALGRELPWDDFPEAPPDIVQAASKLDPDR